MLKLSTKSAWIIICLGITFVVIASFFLNSNLLEDYIKTTEGIKLHIATLNLSGNYTVPIVHLHGYISTDTHGNLIRDASGKIIYTVVNATVTTESRQLFNATFQSPEVFAVGNNITYTIIATPDAHLKIKNIYFIFAPTWDQDYYSNKTKDIPLVLSKTHDAGLLHELNNESSTLFALRNINWSKTGEGQVFFYAILVNENGTYFISPKTIGFLTIAPSIDKIQADTDIDVQREILRTDFTNDIILEFTLIIVGAVPIGVGAEYFIEKHIYELEKSDRDLDYN